MQDNLTFNIDEIDPSRLEVHPYYYTVAVIVKAQLNKKKKVTDETLSWLINPIPIYAAKKSKRLEEMQKKAAERYYTERDKNIRIVRLIKKEFYEFLCTQSTYYKKERNLIGRDINILITGIAAAIATKLGSVETGIITSFVATFFIIVSKMGKKVFCNYHKPKEEGTKNKKQ